MADDDLRDMAIDAAEGALVDAVDEPGQFLARVTDTMLERAVDAVLALADVDGLRAENERLRGINSELVETHNRNLVYSARRDTERDAAVRDLAALRAAVEALTGEIGRRSASTAGAVMRAYQRDSDDLRALLADPTPGTWPSRPDVPTGTRILWMNDGVFVDPPDPTPEVPDGAA